MSICILNEDCLVALPRLAAEGLQAHCCVCDPPYELNFMGRAWDRSGVAFRPETWAAVMACLRPGAHLVAFSGTRTQHRMVCAIEDAGFEIRDTLLWITGQGFPKSLNVSSELRRFLPADAQCSCAPDCPQTVPSSPGDYRSCRDSDGGRPPQDAAIGQGGAPSRADALSRSHSEWREDGPASGQASTSADGASDRHSIESSSPQAMVLCGSLSAGSEPRDMPSSTLSEPPTARRRTEPDRSGKRYSGGDSGDASALLDANLPRCVHCGKFVIPPGVGTALKPAVEMICLARKPLIGTVAANTLRFGTGGLNVDACRVAGGHIASAGGTRRSGGIMGASEPLGGWEPTHSGRWPANVLLSDDPEVEEAFARFGERASAGTYRAHGQTDAAAAGMFGLKKINENNYAGDTGSASRFFFSAKADAADRSGSRHPCVKPTSLMRWLVQLVCPAGGTVLDPFAGTGSTGLAADQLGFDAVLIERDPQYAADAECKIKQDAPLFAEVKLPDLERAYDRTADLFAQAAWQGLEQ